MCDSSYSVKNLLKNNTDQDADHNAQKLPSLVPAHVKAWTAVKEKEILNTIKASLTPTASSLPLDRLSKPSSLASCALQAPGQMCERAQEEPEHRFGRHMFASKHEHRIACLLECARKLSADS